MDLFEILKTCSSVVRVGEYDLSKDEDCFPGSTTDCAEPVQVNSHQEREPQINKLHQFSGLFQDGFRGYPPSGIQQTREVGEHFSEPSDAECIWVTLLC